MKINLGIGVVLAFALFMSFILYFVIEVQSNSKYDNELVVNEYYKSDMKYGEEIEQLQNAADLSEKPKIISTPQGVAVRFPGSIAQNVAGSIAFYRPSSSRMDFEMPLELKDDVMVVPATFLRRGQWCATLKWQCAGTKYELKKRIFRN